MSTFPVLRSLSQRSVFDAGVAHSHVSCVPQAEAKGRSYTGGPAEKSPLQRNQPRGMLAPVFAKGRAMNSAFTAYAALALAIALEVAGSVFLQKSMQFTRAWPTLAMGVLYAGSFYSLTHAIKAMPLSIAYAIWGGVGIILTAAVGYVVFKQAIDFAAIVGIALIVSGVFVINLFSQTAVH
jgi:small multidrug resistance pump